MNEQHTYSIVRTFQVLWVAALTFLLSTSSLMALGADHPAKPVGNSSWPKGMKDLVNSKERIHGYFVNAEDVFFFSGDKERFEKFLADYAKIDGLVSHKIVVHAGVGEAKSPWSKEKGKKCDWMLSGCPSSWKNRDPNDKGYILEIHIWADGDIKLTNLTIPKGVVTEKDEKASEADSDRRD